jgi:hypothetical protein
MSISSQPHWDPRFYFGTELKIRVARMGGTISRWLKQRQALKLLTFPC